MLHNTKSLIACALLHWLWQHWTRDRPWELERFFFYFYSCASRAGDFMPSLTLTLYFNAIVMSCFVVNFIWVHTAWLVAWFFNSEFILYITITIIIKRFFNYYQLLSKYQEEKLILCALVLTISNAGKFFTFI